jgi:hypothetical protein
MLTSVSVLQILDSGQHSNLHIIKHVPNPQHHVRNLEFRNVTVLTSFRRMLTASFIIVLQSFQLNMIAKPYCITDRIKNSEHIFTSYPLLIIPIFL